jgi:hypothetical protein
VHFNSLGDAAYPEHIPFYAFPEEKRAFEAVEKDLRMETETRQSHLRETKEIRGYHIQATDEQTGHVDDYIIDDDKWVIRYLVADTRNIIPGKKVLIAPQWTKGIDWGEAVVYVDVRVKRSETALLMTAVCTYKGVRGELYKYTIEPGLVRVAEMSMNLLHRTHFNTSPLMFAPGQERAM